MVRKESEVPSTKTSRVRPGRDKRSKRSGGGGGGGRYQSEEFPSGVWFMNTDEVRLIALGRGSTLFF